MKYLSIKSSIGFLGLTVSSGAWSHVRWFVEESNTNVSFSWTPLYFLLVGLAVLYALGSYYADRKIAPLYGSSFFKTWPKVSQWDLLAYACGFTFVFISLENIFIAPNIEILQGLETFLLIQAVCGIVLLSALPRWFSGVAVLVLCGMTADAVSMAVWIDYIFEFVAVGIAFILVRWAPSTSLTILRIGLGLQLMVLAIHNKLMDPSLGLAFLSEYNWNFMQLLGMQQFDDLLFVFSAGIAELTFGLLILFAIGTRFVILCVSFFFTLTSIVLGMHELVGHVPILVCCIVLLSLGSGYSIFESGRKLSEHVFEPIQLFFTHRRA